VTRQVFPTKKKGIEECGPITLKHQKTKKKGECVGNLCVRSFIQKAGNNQNQEGPVGGGRKIKKVKKIINEQEKKCSYIEIHQIESVAQE